MTFRLESAGLLAREGKNVLALDFTDRFQRGGSL